MKRFLYPQTTDNLLELAILPSVKTSGHQTLPVVALHFSTTRQCTLQQGVPSNIEEDKSMLKNKF